MKPFAPHVKKNCNASLAKKGVGCGYIMRDDEGRVIFGEAIKLDGVKTVVAAELAAIHLACFRAQDFGMKFVWLESDSLLAVNLINGISAASMENGDILRKISSIASSFEGWTVSHVWWEANRVADKLAKMGGYGNEVIFMEDDVPVGISSIVDVDRLGKIYTRVKNLGSL